jgi:hypothetical protein
MERFSPRLAIIWLGLTIGNFLYRVLKLAIGESADWGHAAEISFFQGVALVAVWLVLRLSKRGTAESSATPGLAVEEGKDGQTS